MDSKRRSSAKRYAIAAVRWGIAIAGIWYVVTNVSLRDRVTVVDPATRRPVQLRLAGYGSEADGSFALADPAPGGAAAVPREQLVRRTPKTTVEVDGERATTLAMDQSSRRLLLEVDGKPRWADKSEITTGRERIAAYPLVDVGLSHMLRDARPALLWASLLLYPICIVLTSRRWLELLKALGIRLSAGRVAVLNLVGMFYNTFMPGSTGGDLVKAYYASKHTPWRTRAVMSVFVDRAIGLVALVLIGAMAAAWVWAGGDANDPAVRMCRRVALASGALLFGLAGGLFVFYHAGMRRLLRIDWILAKLPMQKQVKNAVQALEDYRRQRWTVLGALLISIPVHTVVVISAALAGKAFGLPLSWGYYFAIVPVIVLAGVLPVAPQGAGVMEFLAVLLTQRQGATVAQAFALAMAVRMVPVIWSLLGGVFVLRGDYRVPAEDTVAAAGGGGTTAALA